MPRISSAAAACCPPDSPCSSSPRRVGGLVNDGTLLVIARVVKGMSTAFTAPAGLSIIPTTFEEGANRNRALSYIATGASGFSLGLVCGGLPTEFGWRWTFLLPAPFAIASSSWRGA